MGHPLQGPWGEVKLSAWLQSDPPSLPLHPGLTDDTMSTMSRGRETASKIQLGLKTIFERPTFLALFLTV